MRSSSYAQPKAKKWEPASPGLASNGKPLRIRLIKCQIDAGAPRTSAQQKVAMMRGFSLESRQNRVANNDMTSQQGPNQNRFITQRSLPPLTQGIGSATNVTVVDQSASSQSQAAKSKININRTRALGVAAMRSAAANQPQATTNRQQQRALSNRPPAVEVHNAQQQMMEDRNQMNTYGAPDDEER